MAGRSVLDYISCVQNGFVAEPAVPATLDPTNGHQTSIPRAAAPGAADSAGQLYYYVENTDVGSAHVITIKAGVSTAASFRGGTGDLAVSIDASTAGIIGPLETERFAQADGSILVDCDAGSTGIIIAYMLPNRW